MPSLEAERSSERERPGETGKVNIFIRKATSFIASLPRTRNNHKYLESYVLSNFNMDLNSEKLDEI